MTITKRLRAMQNDHQTNRYLITAGWLDDAQFHWHDARENAASFIQGVVEAHSYEAAKLKAEVFVLRCAIGYGVVALDDFDECDSFYDAQMVLLDKGYMVGVPKVFDISALSDVKAEEEFSVGEGGRERLVCRGCSC